MNKYEEFIKELAEGESGVMHVSIPHIRHMFPELFEVEFEVGKYYKLIGVPTVVSCYTGVEIQGDKTGYGMNHNNSWCNDVIMRHVNKWEPATDEEIKEMLVKEAKKKGFKKGVRFNSASDQTVFSCKSDEFTFIEQRNSLCTSSGGSVFCHGKWATIIEQPLELTVEEISKKYGREVKIVK